MRRRHLGVQEKVAIIQLEMVSCVQPRSDDILKQPCHFGAGYAAITN